MEPYDLTEKTLSSRAVFDGTLLHVCRDTVRLPNGRPATREYIRHVGAVCVVPLTKEGDVIMERQFRYPIGEVLFEIPAGKLNDKTEDPESAARRELREETGITAGKMTFLGCLYPTAAYSDERIGMYLAEDLTFSEAALDEDEFLSVERVPLTVLVKEILAGRVPDAKTQAAVLRVWCSLRKN